LKPEKPMQPIPNATKNRRRFQLGCAAFLTILITAPMLFIVGFLGLFAFSNWQNQRHRQRLVAQEDNIIRWETRHEHHQARRVGHEVNIERYRPFREDNRLVPLGEIPTLTFSRDFPRLDGATAAFPAFAAMAQALYIGLNAQTAQEYVNVSTTYYAYQRLINGEIDIFFGAQPSPQQVTEAFMAGKRFYMTPIAREAFVFFVHEDNPVTDLSVAQIRAIYQRNYTNWSQLGGNHQRILAFQRPQGSGSQTIMEAVVMAGHPMAEPVKEEEHAGMGGIIGYVTVNEYRNVSSAIGYSFRYFVTGMHPAEDIQLPSINGIAPTPENIRTGAYPSQLMSTPLPPNTSQKTPPCC